MVDAPFIIWVLMKLVSVFLKKKMRDRMFVVTSEKLQESGLFASPADCPAACGGTYTDEKETFGSWLAAKAAQRAAAAAAVKLPA